MKNKILFLTLSLLSVFQAFSITFRNNTKYNLLLANERSDETTFNSRQIKSYTSLPNFDYDALYKEKGQIFVSIGYNFAQIALPDKDMDGTYEFSIASDGDLVLENTKTKNSTQIAIAELQRGESKKQKKPVNSEPKKSKKPSLESDKNFNIKVLVGITATGILGYCVLNYLKKSNKKSDK